MRKRDGTSVRELRDQFKLAFDNIAKFTAEKYCKRAKYC